MLKKFFGIAFLCIASGCANLAYYAQAVGGHLQVMHAAKPIPELLSAPDTAPELRHKLEKVAAIREFASRELALPDDGSYRSYADLGRPYVVWNVFAAPKYSIELKKWCFFIVGCVSYRGYYRQAAAEDFARMLQRQGLETYVASIPAYSTLGFFDDPVLNTIVRLGDEEMARLIFHELAHHVAFVAGDSVFNESFATAAENEGMRRWLANTAPDRYANFEARQQRKTQFQTLVVSYRERLKALYDTPLAQTEKQCAKTQLFSELRQDYARLKESWFGFSGYDFFFDQGLNNARLASISLYTGLLPAFQKMMDKSDHDLPSFYNQVSLLAKLSPEERSARLAALVGNAPEQQSTTFTVQHESRYSGCDHPTQAPMAD